jgi:hypothetical protein
MCVHTVNNWSHRHSNKRFFLISFIYAFSLLETVSTFMCVTEGDIREYDLMGNSPLSMFKVRYNFVHRNLVGRSKGLYRFSRVGPCLAINLDVRSFG